MQSVRKYFGSHAASTLSGLESADWARDAAGRLRYVDC
jgi:hypothetical protein